MLTPAARTVTMDVRPVEPANVIPGRVALQAAPIEVPTKPVDGEVNQYPLTTPHGKETSVRAEKSLRVARQWTAGSGEEVVNSDVVPVEGYGTVGVTWAPGTKVADDAIDVKVRTKTGDTWSGWTDAEYHDEHGPDPRTEEGKKARPGTDALLVGEVDAVQVKVTSEDAAPADMSARGHRPGQRGQHGQGGAGDRHRPAALGHRREHAAEHGPQHARRRPEHTRHAGDRPERAARDRRWRPLAAGRRLHAAAEDLLPRPVGRRRADPGQALAEPTTRCTPASSTTR
ncbi:hypothetical protein G5V59_24235 [Nocardioides sp. W3-2-3]|nr:hypothetical protein [Nocardioides convexus]